MDLPTPAGETQAEPVPPKRKAPVAVGIPAIIVGVAIAREDLLRGLTVAVARASAHDTTPAVVTELRPLGAFATWQAERAVGDHDRNTLRLRFDLQADSNNSDPGMTVWFAFEGH